MAICMFSVLFANVAFGAVLHETCNRPGVIALTFDDGPVNHTHEILDILDDLGVKATFHFTIHQRTKGNIGGIYQRAVDEGHVVGLRVNPQRNYENMDDKSVEDDLERQIDALNATAGTEIKYARAPISDGEVNESVYNSLLSKKITQTSYSFCPYDHSEPLEELDMMLKTSNPKFDSFIILMHDAQESENPMLEDIIKIGRENGYSFVTLEECLEGVEPGEMLSGKRSSRVKGGVSDVFIFPFLALLLSLL